MNEPRGSVLLLVLIVVAMLTLASFGLCHLMIEHRRGVSAFGQQLQARAIARSGIAWIANQLMLDEQTVQSDGGLYDNPGRLRGVTVVDDRASGRTGRFSVVAPIDDASAAVDGRSGPIRYGLENESARINLNALLDIEKRRPGAARRLLSVLPGMTEEIADAILDWLDADDQPRRFGAEANDYSGLQPPYLPRNGPLETIEELLMVRGVTPALLFGADRNRNGQLDPGEADQIDTGESATIGGWARYLTLYSRERLVQPDGTPKININSGDLKRLFDDLEAALGSDAATFIVAARQFGVEDTKGAKEAKRSGKNDASGGKKRRRQRSTARPASAADKTVKIDFARPASHTFESVLDLVGTQVRVPAAEEGEAERVVRSPFAARRAAMSDYLPDLMDKITIHEEPTIDGRIHVNRAPPLVLMGVPGMTEQVVDAIVAARDPEVVPQRPGRRHPTWLLTERIVGLKKMKKLLPFLTATGHVYRAQIVGYFDQGGPSARLEVVLDATSRPARRLLWRDISRLGRGFSIDTL